MKNFEHNNYNTQTVLARVDKMHYFLIFCLDIRQALASSYLLRDYFKNITKVLPVIKWLDFLLSLSF